MKMTKFCDHLYDESTDGYIQILKIDDKENNGEKTIKIYNTKNLFTVNSDRLLSKFLPSVLTT